MTGQDIDTRRYFSAECSKHGSSARHCVRVDRATGVEGLPYCVRCETELLRELQSAKPAEDGSNGRAEVSVPQEMPASHYEDQAREYRASQVRELADKVAQAARTVDAAEAGRRAQLLQLGLDGVCRAGSALIQLGARDEDVERGVASLARRVVLAAFAEE